MRTNQNQKLTVLVLFFFSALFSSCLTTKKMDAFVAQQYNNQLPKEARKKNADIIVSPVAAPASAAISTTVRKRDKFLPLIVYWRYDYRLSCNLNPSIGAINFSNSIHSAAGKSLSQKLNGAQLQLTIEQMPNVFALVNQGHTVWVVYTFSWYKVFMEPDAKDLIVSYQLLQNNNTVKSGKILVKNTTRSKGLRFFQSWKSATSEYLAYYNAEMTNMTKTFVSKLAAEL